MTLLSIMRYYNNAASFVFIVFSWRFFKLFLVDVESIITLKGRKGKGRELGRGGKRPYLPSPFRAFLPLPHPLPTSFCASHASYLDPNYVQGSHKLLDPKFKTFARLSKTIIFFPDSRLSNRWSIDLLKKKHRNKAFFMMRCKRTGEIE